MPRIWLENSDALRRISDVLVTNTVNNVQISHLKSSNMTSLPPAQPVCQMNSPCSQSREERWCYSGYANLRTSRHCCFQTNRLCKRKSWRWRQTGDEALGGDSRLVIRVSSLKRLCCCRNTPALIWKACFVFDCRAEESEQEETCWSFVRRSCDRLTSSSSVLLIWILQTHNVKVI